MTDISEISIDATQSIKLLPVLKYESTVTETKVTFSQKITLKFIKGIIINDQKLYVHFPGFDF